ncbi:MAG: hypothetical protein AABY64_08915 [Bdellovibrionota bacterium]
MLRRYLNLFSLSVSFLFMALPLGFAQESGQVSVTGTVIKNLTAFSWVGLKTSSGHIYKLKAESAEVTATLSKLEEGALISGFGQIDDSSKVASLQSLSFIGLKRLLGFWWTSLGFAEIRTFSEMNFYSQPQPNNRDPATIKTSYQYSISPSTNPSWVIFLSDDQGVYYTSMDFQGASAEMRMYNPETGALIKTIDFTRINH